eukprot:12410367-Alexandrium_andersonii.AAC.1
MTDKNAGTYLPFACIVREEGGDEEAVAAAYRYVASAAQKHLQGESVHGRAWVARNQMTKRNEFFH